jgi:hypothetical protein
MFAASTASGAAPMIELVIVYCLAADTKACVERRLPMEHFASQVGCTMSGQLRAQEYLREHPAYVLKSWRCEDNVPTPI